ncbi:MAG: ABC transporter ATP-binding protein [Oscillospiraceae bacterium]|nr:ABC transporter ATP-binding protein [Oscillospiraceae bacterium]
MRKAKENTVGETLKFMLKTVRREKPSVFFLYLLAFVTDFAAKMSAIILPKFLIDELVLIIGGEPLENHLSRIIIYAALIVGIALSTNLLLNLEAQLMSVRSEWFNQYFETELSRHTMAMDFEHTEDPEALDKLSKAKDGMSWYSGGAIGILTQLYTVISNAAILLSVSFLIIITCPWLIPVQLISLVLITIFNAKNNKIEAEGFMQLSKMNRVWGYVFYQLSDFRYGKDIRLYNSADMMCEKADTISEQQVAVWKGQQREMRPNNMLINTINALRDGMSYFYIGFLAVTKAITIGDFQMCINSASNLYWSLYHIVTSVQELHKRCSYAHRYLEFTAYPAAMVKGNKPVKDGEHTIEFSHVSFKYPRSDNYVLRDVNITIRSGEHLSVVGLNGAGKTTFIKLLCRLYDVTEGEILVDGVNIKEYSEEEYRRLFAVVFQDFQLFAFSLRENIALADTPDDERIEEVLKQSGFYDDAHKLEHGLNTTLFKSFDEKGTELSGGQQQKTAISRALYRNAPVVILDEPTAALDPVAEYEIYRQFNSLVGGKTAIYISHRLSSCKFCDRIAVFADDTIKEYGTHDELADKPGGIYAEMFSAQAQYYVNCTE